MLLQMLRTKAILVIGLALALPPWAIQAQVVVAHRGASFDAPENTIAAFEEAWRQEADGIEGDFYVTKDSQIVCIHDPTTERTSEKKLHVATSTLAELQELDFGSWKDSKFQGEPIPTFEDVLKTVPPGKLFVIELKTGPEIIPLLKAELERLDPQRENLLIIAFNPKTIIAAKKELPDIRAHWLIGYKQDRADGTWHPSVDEVAATLKQTGADGLGTMGVREVVTKEFIETLKRDGLKEFHVWTIDKPADAKYFQQLGAVGITTNRPAYIRERIFELQLAD